MTAQLWNPHYERGRRLQAWYDASYTAGIEHFAPYSSDGVRTVGIVHDRSGYARAVINMSGLAINQLRYMRRMNGLPVLSLFAEDTTSLRAEIPSTLYSYNGNVSGFSCYWVVRAWQWVNGAYNDGAGTYFTDRQGGFANPPLWSLKVSSDQFMLQVRNNAGSGLTLSQFIAPITAGKASLISTMYTPVGGGYNIRAWYDGAPMVDVATSLGMIDVQPIALGYPEANTTSPSDVDVSEVLFMNNGEDVRLRQRTEGYLASKWGIPLAMGHPYYARAPQSGSDSPLMLADTYAARVAASDALKLRASTNGARALFTLG